MTEKDKLEVLDQLGKLRERGVLSDEEFEREKAKVLADAPEEPARPDEGALAPPKPGRGALVVAAAVVVTGVIVTAGVLLTRGCGAEPRASHPAELPKVRQEPAASPMGSHFDAREDDVGFGIVTAHGADMFTIMTGTGIFTPFERARQVADRLNRLLAGHEGEPNPEMFRVATIDDEVVIQHHMMHEERGPMGSFTWLVTIDQRLAERFPGAGGDRDRLARWWLALFQDHLSLALGLQPSYTTDTHCGKGFLVVYRKAREMEPTGVISHATLVSTIAQIDEYDREHLWRLAHTGVPDDF